MQQTEKTHTTGGASKDSGLETRVTRALLETPNIQMGWYDDEHQKQKHEQNWAKTRKTMNREQHSLNGNVMKFHCKTCERDIHVKGQVKSIRCNKCKTTLEGGELIKKVEDEKRGPKGGRGGNRLALAKASEMRTAAEAAGARDAEKEMQRPQPGPQGPVNAAGTAPGGGPPADPDGGDDEEDEEEDPTPMHLPHKLYMEVKPITRLNRGMWWKAVGLQVAVSAVCLRSVYTSVWRGAQAVVTTIAECVRGEVAPEAAMEAMKEWAPITLRAIGWRVGRMSLFPCLLAGAFAAGELLRRHAMWHEKFMRFDLVNLNPVVYMKDMRPDYMSHSKLTYSAHGAVYTVTGTETCHVEKPGDRHPLRRFMIHFFPRDERARDMDVDAELFSHVAPAIKFVAEKHAIDRIENSVARLAVVNVDRHEHRTTVIDNTLTLLKAYHWHHTETKLDWSLFSPYELPGSARR